MSTAGHPLETVLSSRIRAARRTMPFENGRRVSQQALAERIGVHVITVSQWERGRSAPTVSNLIAISEATGKPMQFFTGDADDEEEAECRLRELISLLMKREQWDIASELLNEVRLAKARRAQRQESPA